MSTAAAGDGAPPAFSRRFVWAGGLLGFALGGFFDGILLHQVLQWHHLLINIQSPPFQDIGVQILADGLFHGLMYVLAAAGLWLLWRTRHEFAAPGADRRLLAHALIGFGAWHILDGVLSHWVLGIHRIRVDVDNKLFWDLLWFVVFGVAFAAAGWRLRRGGSGGPGGLRRAVTPALLVAAVLIAGPVAALPPPGVTSVVVLFGPGTTAREVFAAAAAVGARVMGSDPSGRVRATGPR